MSDPKSFLAAVGRMAEAVSGRVPSLVERLRKSAAYASDGWAQIRVLAADEIERLTSQLSDLEAAKNDALTLANLREAEIERLEAERNKDHARMSDAIGLAVTRAQDAEAEVARLKEALKLMVGWFGGPHDDHSCPQDDTCACPSVALVNRAIAHPPEPTDAR